MLLIRDNKLHYKPGIWIFVGLVTYSSSSEACLPCACAWKVINCMFSMLSVSQITQSIFKWFYFPFTLLLSTFTSSPLFHHFPLTYCTSFQDNLLFSLNIWQVSLNILIHPSLSSNIHFILLSTLHLLDFILLFYSLRNIFLDDIV